jgi:signal transduction histidine kinase
MASATSSRPAPSKPRWAAGISEARALDAPLRALAHARRVAPLLYFELTGLDSLEGRDVRRISALCAAAVAGALRGAVGSLLRRNDVVAAGPAERWFAALLLDRAVPARERAAVSDADLGIVAGRLRNAIRSSLDELHATEDIAVRVGVRAGWTIIEPRDDERPLAELRHALRGAAVVARVEERRATVLAAITHELRTPLTSILGYAEQLSGDGWENKQKRTRALRIVADESRRLARLVEGLIDAGAWQAGHLTLRKRAVKLRSIVDRAVAATSERAASRSICVRTRGNARASVDPERLLQVLVNLIDNAARHARAGGSVHVAIAVLRAKPSITVSDDGPGFCDADPNVLGTPFGVGRSGRTGLGLAISKMLVEAHGGLIDFGSSRRGGARVTIRLPASS